MEQNIIEKLNAIRQGFHTSASLGNLKPTFIGLIDSNFIKYKPKKTKKQKLNHGLLPQESRSTEKPTAQKI
ncbi:hypothetical protein HK16_12405 [Acetobacter senegalensis]|uniref:Uncharacterized protein n=2 Tax=Acetobacteraceae TaxID=433 RepID=A0A252EI47_9PROT|nr:hypothetical protein HK16_12405 [Acetobacter senegalensis]